MIPRAVIALVLGLALLMPAGSAAAEPIKVTLRLVPGDAVHYTAEGHLTANSNSASAELPSQIKLDYNMGVLMTVEETLPDGSARVREEIDQVDIAGLDQSDVDQLVGRTFTFIAHPDGSWTPVADERGQADNSVLNALLPAGGNSSFPSQGLDVGQSAERKVPFNLLGPEKPIDLPVKTTLEALAVEDGHPAAKLHQSFNVPDTETPFGPFGATGTATLHISGDATYSVDLDTGWPLRMGGAVGYGLAVQGEGQQQGSVDVQLQYAMVLDQLTLADQ